VGLLLEVVVATFLLAVVVVPVFCGIAATALAARQVQMVTEAQQLLQARAEEIKAQGGVTLSEGTIYLQTYEGEPFTIEQEVIYTGMTLNPDNPASACVVKKVVLRAYREPMRPGDWPLTFMEFLIYDQGI